MKVNNLIKTHKSKRRIARGNAGKGGTTAGRGTKGQKSRTSSGRIPVGFEGGQTRWSLRMPQLKGFKNRFSKKYQIVNLKDIEKEYKTGEEVNFKTLLSKSLIKNRKTLIKVLSNGDLTKKIDFKVNKISKTAEKKIKKAGGKIIQI